VGHGGPVQLCQSGRAAEVVIFAFSLIYVIVEYWWMLKLWGEEMKLDYILEYNNCYVVTHYKIYFNCRLFMFSVLII
jgi:hypothetical protein